MGFEALNDVQRAALNRGRFFKLADILLTSSDNVARRCRISPLEARNIIEIAAYDEFDDIKPLEAFTAEPDTCTTGDEHLDRALGGGIRTGMIWEFAGESGAGKTQLALHLSLMIQLPKRLGGLSGSACYLITSSSLQTERLIELINSHPQLSPVLCGLEAIHTMPCPTIPLLLHILRETLPLFIEQQSHSEPVKLLVIDALGELFHTTDKTSKTTLVERSIDIAQISALLHSIASMHNIAIVVLNEVVDTFDRGFIESDENHLSYSDQARWFSRASTLAGEDKKEASLGLVWANQVNVRVQMSRTGRRRYLNDFESTKRQKQHQNTVKASRDTDDQTTLIRRLSVIFSSVAPPASIDYIVTSSGLFGIPEEGASKPPSISLPLVATAATVCPLSTQVPPLDRESFDDDGLEPSNDSWDWDGLPDSEETGDIS